MAKKTSVPKSSKTTANASGKKPLAKASTRSKKPPEPQVSPKKVTAELFDENQKSASPFLTSESPSPELVSPDLDSIPLLESTNKSVSTRDPVSIYLSEIKKYQLLTREQEQDYARKYFETKDPKYAQVLVTANLRFVVKVAAEYSRFGARMIDLIQEGNMGLMHAVKDFNPYKGVRLITYAVWWIRGYIQEYLMKQFSLVKIGTTQNQKKLFYQLQKQKEELEKLAEGGEQLALISARLGIPEEEIQIMAQRLSGRDVSLDKPIDSDTPTSLLDFQKSVSESPDNELEKKEQFEKLHRVIDELKPTLNDKEKIILDERILNDEPLTLQEIGDKYGITREAVRQAEVRVIRKIKELMQD